MSDETTTTAPPPRLKDMYLNEVRPKLQEQFAYGSPMQLPRITKITLSMGVGRGEAEQQVAR